MPKTFGNEEWKRIMDENVLIISGLFYWNKLFFIIHEKFTSVTAIIKEILDFDWLNTFVGINLLFSRLMPMHRTFASIRRIIELFSFCI